MVKTMSWNNIIPVARVCEHDWLKPESNRTTCKLCGRDGYIYLDRGSDIEEELINLQARCDELERKLEIAAECLRIISLNYMMGCDCYEEAIKALEKIEAAE